MNKGQTDRQKEGLAPKEKTKNKNQRAEERKSKVNKGNQIEMFQMKVGRKPLKSSEANS